MSYKKQIFKLNDLKKFLTEENSCISLMPTVRLLALPPFFLNDMKSGILYLLNNMLKKYDRSLGGIVIGYQNIKVLMDENTGIIPIGTSETEVNVSVEFYIFQPRIGSCLEGVINKISNNHIGCLVHQYFNATILKPDDVNYEDWICKDFNVDDKIIFKVKDLDFTGLLPYIEGVIGNESVLNNNDYSKHKNCDTDSLVANNLRSSSNKEISHGENYLRHKVTLDENSDDDFLENEKIKNKNVKIHTLESNVNKNLDKIDSFMNLKKKKKKKEKEEKKHSIFDYNNSKKDKYYNDEEIKSSTSTLNQVDESQLIEKKKKKKKKSNDIGRNNQDSATVESVKVNPDGMNHTIVEKLVLVEDENSREFIKPFKKRKEKKKKNEEEEPQIFNKISQCLSSSKTEDNVLYSTLLDPIQSKKMRISCCSPIPQATPVRRNKGKSSSTKDLFSTVQINSQNESDKKEKKKKEKKRKREEKESEIFSLSKKIKTLHPLPSKKEAKESMVIDDEDKLEVQTVMEQLYDQQLNKVKDTTYMSDKGNCKEESKKKKKVKKRKKELIKNKVLDINKHTEIQINGESDIEKKSETKSNKLETHRVEELNNLKEQSFKKNKGTDMKVNKGKEIFNEKMTENLLQVNKISEDQKNSVKKEEKKSEVQNMLDELLKQEMDRVKNSLKCSETESVGERKNIKAAVNKEEIRREGSHLSLYDKLLKEAKSSVELDRDKLPHSLSVKELRKNKNIKDSDLSDLSTSSSKKKSSGKKKKHNKDKAEGRHRTPDKCRNGSMYDALANEEATPEKVNPDKSLFSDSEQSHTSPVKKMKEANEIETKVGNSLVQNMLNELCEEKRKRLQYESDKESLISLKKQEKKKSKLEQKAQSTNEKKDSLYEKLLKEARSLIDSKGESPPKKKKK